MRLVRRIAEVGTAFSPEWLHVVWAGVVAQNLEQPNPPRPHRSCPQRIKQICHNSYRVKHPKDVDIKHEQEPVPVLYPRCLN